jgi:hypothetical protein
MTLRWNAQAHVRLLWGNEEDREMERVLPVSFVCPWCRTARRRRLDRTRLCSHPDYAPYECMQCLRGVFYAVPRRPGDLAREIERLQRAGCELSELPEFFPTENDPLTFWQRLCRRVLGG